MRSFSKIFSSFVGVVILSVVSVLAVLAIIISTISPIISYWVKAPDFLPDTTFVAEHIKMFDKNNELFAETWTENRETVNNIKDISPHLIHAIISAEDKDFFHHNAIDVKATLRSFLHHSGGGSGITQQLMKNLQYLSVSASKEDKKEATSNTIARKMRELKLAFNYERTHSKNSILLKYLNTVAVGSGNIYGVKTASREIFGKDVKDLNIEEAAVLAGTVNNPSRFNLLNLADKNVYEDVKQRQIYVLTRMFNDGHITKAELNKAVKAKIEPHYTTMKGGCGNSSFPFYCRYVLDYILQDTRFGATQEERNARIARGGLAIYTNLDPVLTRQAEQQVKSDLGINNRVAMPVAFVSKGGKVIALAQNREWGTDESTGQTQIVLPNVGTPAGSTYKMITLATAMSQGWDENRLNAVNGYCPWKKAGFDTPSKGIMNSNGCQSFQVGKIGIFRATAYSSNTYFAELSSEVGVNNIVNMSRKLGLPVPNNIGAASASFTLGTTNVSPIQMAAAYNTFANQGVYCPPTPIRNYSNLDGSQLQVSDSYDPSSGGCRAVLTPKQASFVLKAQNANINDGSIAGRFGAEGGVNGHLTVGKSGTSENWSNTVWSTTVGQYTAFANAYDPRGNFAHPLTSYIWRGAVRGPYFHSSMSTTRDIISKNLANQPNIGLDLDSQNNSYVDVPKNRDGVKTVPYVVGMDAQSALTTMRNANINSHVMKITAHSEIIKGKFAKYAPGTVIKQSIPAGTRFSNSSKKIVELMIVK